jgi:hypothetical protein
LIQLKPKAGSWGKNAIGGLIFGLGFALLGYCPGTIAGAIGNGHLDALAGGLTGILLGSGLLAAAYPRLKDGILRSGGFGDLTLPRLFRVNDWAVIVPLSGLLLVLLYVMERAGL